MSRVSDAPMNGAGAETSAPRTRHVCPFCGTLNEAAVGPCVKCTMQNTPQTRRVTRGRIGPWYVLQSRNPAAPGMRFDVLVSFIRKGQVTARSIVRGPTTHQFWKYAAHVKGLSREFGLCYACGIDISPDSTLCAHCGKLQEPPISPDVLLESSAGETFRPVNGRVGTASPVQSERAPVPEMVDAEVVIETNGHHHDAATNGRRATRVVIEPVVEPRPPLAEPDPVAREEETNGHTNGHAYGNGHAYAHEAASNGHTEATAGDATRPTKDPGTALMSPSDLAAAFHLKFSPIAEFDHQPAPEERPSRLVAVLSILAVLVVGVVVVALVFPEQRTIAVDWAVRQFTAAKAWLGPTGAA